MFNRVFYDRSTGKILYQLFMDNPETVTDFAVLEVPTGEINYDTHYIESINPDGEPVIKAKELTQEELEKAKLKEDILLLKTENEIGGIL